MAIDRSSVRELLALDARVMDALRERGVVRSSNNPVADYAEGLCARALGLTLVHKSTAGYDATDPSGRRYEIKARRITPKNKSRQLSAIRGLERQQFDLLVGVLFHSDFSIMRGALVPHSVVVQLAMRVEHTNSWRFLLRDAVWSQPSVEDITERLKAAQG